MPKSVVSFRDCLSLCQKGNNRFVSGTLSYHGLDEIRRHEAAEQRPHTAVLSCSDSRVPIELIFDQNIGDLFVVRSAGNTAFSEAIASIEYAVLFLKIRLIVVMGHTQCGAVLTALNKPELPRQASHLCRLIDDIHTGELEGSQNQERAIWNNAKNSIAKILHQSAVIRAAYDDGKIGICPAVYDIGSGQVSFDRAVSEKEGGIA